MNTYDELLSTQDDDFPLHISFACSIYGSVKYMDTHALLEKIADGNNLIGMNAVAA